MCRELIQTVSNKLKQLEYSIELVPAVSFIALPIYIEYEE